MSVRQGIMEQVESMIGERLAPLAARIRDLEDRLSDPSREVSEAPAKRGPGRPRKTAVTATPETAEGTGTAFG